MKYYIERRVTPCIIKESAYLYLKTYITEARRLGENGNYYGSENAYFCFCRALNALSAEDFSFGGAEPEGEIMIRTTAFEAITNRLRRLVNKTWDRTLLRKEKHYLSGQYDSLCEEIRQLDDNSLSWVGEEE